MKKYPTITVFVVIAVHVALCWCAHLLIPHSIVADALWSYVCLGVVATPLVLLLFLRKAPFLARVGIALAAGGVPDRDNYSSQFLICSWFAVLLIGFGLLARLLTGWILDNGRSFAKRTFSLRQLLAATTVIALVTAVLRLSLENDWQGWFGFPTLSLATFLLLCSVFSQWGVAYGLCFFVAVIVISTIGALREFEDRGWFDALVFMTVTGNATLPAIALRLCGWHWVRPQRALIATESPGRGEIS